MTGSGQPDLVRTASADSPFALIHRRGANPDSVEVFRGDAYQVPRLDDLPLDRPRTLVVVPYRQAAERGFQVRDDHAPLLAMPVREYTEIPLPEALRQLPMTPLNLQNADFDVDDPEYADIVKRIITDDIGGGEGSNFVIRRSFRAVIPDYSASHALAIFRNLLTAEHGAYWTYLVHLGSRTFVGASPERHVRLQDGVMTMNPVSGTYRYGPHGPVREDLLRFLTDEKEVDELFMVVDEELKMMARVCPYALRVRGPHLRRMARLAHTGYLLSGRTGSDVRRILAETMFAPTVTGSPVENAFRVIARHEPEPRGYYGGVLALVDRGSDGRQAMDSAIMIRSAEIDRHGGVRIGVGATLVRHSDPQSEVAETHAKVAALLDALRTRPPEPLAEPPAAADHPADDRQVAETLRRRNQRLARFWLDGSGTSRPDPRLTGRRVLLVDAEDTFTGMLAKQIAALGPSVELTSVDQVTGLDRHDLVLVGPGPGDPRRTDDPRIARLRAITRRLLRTGRPFLSICLGHQMLAQALGLRVVRKPTPNQGRQRVIELFGTRRTVGYYNTFAAVADVPRLEHPLAGPVDVCRDPRTGEVEALRGNRFQSMQFHPESVLSVDGFAVLRESLTALLHP